MYMPKITILKLIVFLLRCSENTQRGGGGGGGGVESKEAKWNQTEGTNKQTKKKNQCSSSQQYQRCISDKTLHKTRQYLIFFPRSA